MGDVTGIDMETAVTGKPKEIAVLPEITKAWMDNLPTKDIRSGYTIATRAPGDLLAEYASRWDGNWNPDTSILRLAPKLTHGIVQEGDGFYDQGIAIFENGAVELKTDSGYKPVPNIFDKLTENDVPITLGTDRLMFRGVNYEGMQSILINGSLEPGSHTAAGGEEGKLFFAVDPMASFDYAENSEAKIGGSTFEKPSYVFTVKWPTGINANDGGEIVLKDKAIPLNEVVRIYEIRPYETQVGNIEMNLVQQNGLSYMQLPGLVELLETLPKSKFAYRELSLSDVQKDFGIIQPEIAKPPESTPKTI
jgi:hypothetical protein